MPPPFWKEEEIVITLTDAVALVREEGQTRVYQRDRSTCTVQLTPKTMAKRDALLAKLLREGAPGGSPEVVEPTQETEKQ